MNNSKQLWTESLGINRRRLGQKYLNPPPSANYCIQPAPLTEEVMSRIHAMCQLAYKSKTKCCVNKAGVFSKTVTKQQKRMDTDLLKDF